MTPMFKRQIINKTLNFFQNFQDLGCLLESGLREIIGTIKFYKNQDCNKIFCKISYYQKLEIKKFENIKIFMNNEKN